jgi:soluble lytic murein transglycosylase
MALLLRWLPIGSTAMALWLAAGTPAHALDSEQRAILWETFQAAERKEWQRALRLAALVEDPLAAKTVRWLRMIEDGEPADFATIAQFLIDNPDWPWPEQLQTLAEGTIIDPADHALIRRLFADRPPLTTRGHIRYAEALLKIGQDEQARALIRKAWIEGDFSAREEKRFLQKYRRVLSRDDHIARLDNLLWDYRRNSAKRMLPLVPDGYRSLANARMRLQRRQNGLDKAIEAVPASLRNDPGLTFDRMRWRRQKRSDRGVLEMLLDPPEELGRPALWWFERELQIRRALRKRNFQLAYDLASRHRQSAGAAFAEAEWLAGWLALRFLHQPNTALRHFTRLHDSVQAPVDRASAAYWAGRSAAALGAPSLAEQWYQFAAAVPIAYYGQLAAEELGEAGRPLPDPPPADPLQRTAFERLELVRVARMLIEAVATEQLTPFLIRLGEQASNPTQVGLVAELAATSGRPHLVAQVGRTTAYYGAPNHVAAFPIPEIAGLLRPAPGEPEPALLMGVGRQESMFNPWVSSHAGARGLLQLIPRTAFLMARQLGLPYSPGRLVGDPEYNVRLGSHYLKTLLKHYDGEVALAVAAYNAGPRRVDEWIRLHGDPRRRDRSALIDWIELIPFDETRNYVQRVLEGHNLYRRRLASDNPTTVWFRPVNGPLEPLPWPALKPLDEVVRITIADLVERAPRPRLKPGGPTEPIRVLPAGYHSQSHNAPVPVPKSAAAFSLADELPLPAPKPTRPS